jgi:hypothetical protein
VLINYKVGGAYRKYFALNFRLSQGLHFTVEFTGAGKAVSIFQFVPDSCYYSNVTYITDRALVQNGCSVNHRDTAHVADECAVVIYKVKRLPRHTSTGLRWYLVVSSRANMF